MIIFHILQRLVSYYFIAECIENWLTWIFFFKQLNKIQDLLKVANVGTPTKNHEKNEKKSISGKCHK